MFDLFDKKLPVRFPPEHDELFSSWLVRLATAHHIKLHNFSKHIFGNRRIWNRDIDQSADAAHIEKIVEYTGIDQKRIFASTLRHFEGTLYEKHNPGGILRWLLPVGIYRQIRKRFGLQMCPLCLAEDKAPYYRRLWRISWATVCVRHNVKLIDKCGGCRTPVMFHRGDMGWRNQSVSLSMVRCSKCDLSWTSRQISDSLTKADADVTEFQRKLEDAVRHNWINVKAFGYVHSINFFNGLRNILRILSVSRRTPDFRKAAARRSGLLLGENLDGDNRVFSFEYLSVLSRYNTLRLASWLIDDWSDRFIGIAKETKTYISALLPYNETLPFWYWSPIYTHLVKKPYSASEQEIHSALSYLTKTKPLIVIKDLKNLLGTDIFKGKSERFIISIYEKVRKSNEQNEEKRLLAVRTKAKEIRSDENFSKRAALEMSRAYLGDAKKPLKRFNKTQRQLDYHTARYKRQERLKMARRMEMENNSALVCKEFGVSPGIITKWYRRYKDGGAESLNDRSRAPHNTPHKKVFKSEEIWIQELHSEGLELKEIQKTLKSRYNFEMTEGGLYRALQRLNLILPCSKKNRFVKRNRKKVSKQKSYPQKKIFAEQEKWILELHGEGFNGSQIKRELVKRYDFRIGRWAIRETLIRCNVLPKFQIE